MISYYKLSFGLPFIFIDWFLEIFENGTPLRLFTRMDPIDIKMMKIKHVIKGGGGVVPVGDVYCLCNTLRMLVNN